MGASIQTFVEKWAASGAAERANKDAEQIAAVRELVTRTSDAWSADQVAAAFKGAKKTTVAGLLDGLAALGLLVSYETSPKAAAGAPRSSWRSPTIPRNRARPAGLTTPE